MCKFALGNDAVGEERRSVERLNPTSVGFEKCGFGRKTYERDPMFGVEDKQNRSELISIQKFNSFKGVDEL
jgi:hypothetical protein